MHYQLGRSEIVGLQKALMLKRLEEVARLKDPPAPAAVPGYLTPPPPAAPTAGAAAAWKKFQELFNSGETIDAKAAAGLNHDQATTWYATALATRGWSSEIIHGIEANLAWRISNESAWVQQIHLLDRAYSINIASAQVHGNALLIREAVNRYQVRAFRGENSAQMDQYSRPLESIAKRPDPSL